jgi:hypothetical protein
MYYIGLDVHKWTISYCVQDGSGKIHAKGAIPATRFDLDRWMSGPQQWKPLFLPAGSTITCCRTQPCRCRLANKEQFFVRRSHSYELSPDKA